MNFRLFIESVKENVKERLGAEYIINVEEVIKNNGVKLEGLVILKPGDNVTPTIYLNSYFEKLKCGTKFENIIVDIIKCYQESVEKTLNVENLKSFESIKDKLAFKLINANKNKDMLDSTPFVPYLDLAIVFYLKLDNGEDFVSTLIHNDIMQLWNVTQDDLYRMAMLNSQVILPVSIRPINDVMADMGFGNGNDEVKKMSKQEVLDEMEMVPFLVLSNNSGMNGAASMLYDGVLEQTAEKCGTDIIILPSSVHEVLLLPFIEEMDIEGLQDMVININRTELSKEDFLSDHVYLYKRGSGVHIAI